MPFRSLLLLGFFLCSVQFIFAQNDRLLLKSDSIIHGSNNQLIGLVVHVENKSELEGQFLLQVSGSERLNFLKKSSKITLKPNEKEFHNFQIFITKIQPAGESPIEFKLYDSNGKVVAKHTTKLQIETKRSLKIITPSPQEVIHQLGDSLRLETKIINGGNLKERVKLIATIPTIGGSLISIEKTVEVNSYTTVPVQFSKIIDKDLLDQELFNVNIAMVSEHNEYIGNVMILVQNALGNRRYSDPNLQRLLANRAYQNEVGWSISNPFGKNESTQVFDLNTTINARSLTSKLSVHALHYSNPGLSTIFQNTFLDLEYNGKGVRFGNIAGTDLDISMNGRGVEFYSSSRPGKKSSYKIGALEKAYDLFSPLNTNDSPYGYSAFATKTYKLTSNSELQTDLVYDIDQYTKSLLANSTYQHNGINSSYSIVAGYGYTENRQNEDLDKSSLYDPKQKNSLAIGFNLTTKYRKYTLNTQNYYSSPYYPGIRKGSLQLDQRIGRAVGKHNYWLGYHLSIYNPKSISPLFNFATETKRNRLELGGNFRFDNNFSLTVTPLYQSERSLSYADGSQELKPIEFQSVYLSTNASVSTNNYKHRFSLNLSQGLSRYLDYTKANYIFKGQLNYYFSNLTVSLMAQKGNFQFYEGARNLTLSNGNDRFSALVSYQMQNSNKKLNWYLNAMASKDSFLGNSISGSTNVSYNLWKNTKIFGYYTYSNFARDSYKYSSSYVQFGITQSLPEIGDPNVDYKNGTIEVYIYHDLNNNGTYDLEFDQPAVGKKISINKTIFITGKDGMIRYRRVPYGDYTIRSNENEWFSDPISINLNSRSEKLTLALAETGRISGQLRYDTYNKNQYEVLSVLSGIPVLFKYQNKRIFTFYTDEKGKFNAYVPLGKYEVHVDSDALQQHVYVDTPPQRIEAKKNEISRLPTTILKIRERKVEIKRFGE